MTDYDKSILPGGEGKIRASLDTAHYSGPISKTITVTTDDPAKATFTLTLKADIFTYVEISPSKSISLRTQAGQEAAQTVTLSPKGVKELALKKITLEHPSLLYTLDPPLGSPVMEGQIYTLTLKAPRNLAAGSFSGSMTIATSIAEQSTLTIAYSVTVEAPIQIVPSNLNIRVSSRPAKCVASGETIYYADADETSAPLGILNAGEAYAIWQYNAPWAQVQLPGDQAVWVRVDRLEKIYSGSSATALVKGSQAKPFTILEATSDISGVQVEIKTGQIGQYTLSCRYETRSLGQSLQGRVVIKTDQPGARELSCPLSITSDGGHP